MSATRPSSAGSQRRQSPADLLRLLFRSSRPSIPAGQFYPTFLQMVTVALRAPSACVWRQHQGRFQVLAHRQVDQVGMRSDSEAWIIHQALLGGIARDQKPVRLKPGEVTPAGKNPLNMELFCVPFTADAGDHFVIEVFSPAVPADANSPKKGRLARLNQLCEFFRDYVQSQELRLKAEQADVETGLRLFLSRLNAVSTSQELAVVAVNEGRQVIGCERVSLGWMAGRNPRILSVSGHDTIDPRSNVLRALSNLTRAATESGRILQLSFLDTEGAANTATQLPSAELNRQAPVAKTPESDESVRVAYQSAVESYSAADRPRHLLVIPLRDANEPGKGQGALIVEQFQVEGLASAAVSRATFVADQVRLSLRRLELLESVPLLSWWSRPSRGAWSRRIRRTVLVALAIAVVTGLALLPMELRLPADGELLAETRHAVFAPDGGIVREVHVDHGSRVRAGDPLVTIDNLELSAQLRELTGQLVQSRDRQRSLEARRSGTRLTEREQIELQSGLVELATSVEHTERQIKMLQERLDRLKIVAPADGVISSWNVKQTLLHRTVLPGNALLQEIEPTGTWMIELRIPEDRVGYVTRYLSEMPTGESLAIEFVLATEPERRYPGQLRRIGARTELTADGHIVRAVIDVDPDNLPPLRDGAEVKARLHCGLHRAGFVWFRELIEVIQTYWWY